MILAGTHLRSVAVSGNDLVIGTRNGDIEVVRDEHHWACITVLDALWGGSYRTYQGKRFIHELEEELLPLFGSRSDVRNLIQFLSDGMVSLGGSGTCRFASIEQPGLDHLNLSRTRSRYSEVEKE